MLQSLPFNDELNALHRNRRIFVDQGDVARSQIGKFAPPTGIGDLYLQNAIGKAERARPIGDRTAASDGPRQQRTLIRWRTVKRFGDDVFQSGGSAVQVRPQSS
jgi:hypothetical protein